MLITLLLDADMLLLIVFLWLEIQVIPSTAALMLTRGKTIKTIDL